MIGVIGGAGPFAGLDLLQKIMTHTVAQSDQDHLTVVTISQPAAIPDRTAYLLGKGDLNPARPIVEQLRRLAGAGATVAGIPCNTAHAPPIMDVIKHELAASPGSLRLIHMIEEVGQLLQRHYAGVKRVGVLSTIGTARSRVYPMTLEPLGLRVITPDDHVLADVIHPAIYDPGYGIKACGIATEKARADLLTAVQHLEARGAQAVILGCTELPLAFDGNEDGGMPLIDSTLALARALIRAVDPGKLRPWMD